MGKVTNTGLDKSMKIKKKILSSKNSFIVILGKGWGLPSHRSLLRNWEKIEVC